MYLTEAGVESNPIRAALNYLNYETVLSLPEILCIKLTVPVPNKFNPLLQSVGMVK